MAIPSNSKPGKKVLGFGKYKGQSIDSIATSDAGLKYLDWLVGQSWVFADVRKCLEEYLGDPVIKRELERLINE